MLDWLLLMKNIRGIWKHLDVGCNYSAEFMKTKIWDTHSFYHYVFATCSFSCSYELIAGFHCVFCPIVMSRGFGVWIELEILFLLLRIYLDVLSGLVWCLDNLLEWLNAFFWISFFWLCYLDFGLIWFLWTDLVCL